MKVPHFLITPRNDSDLQDALELPASDFPCTLCDFRLTVLIHYQHNGILYQAILMINGSVPGGKGGVDTHKLWKYVLQCSMEVVWLPRDLAEAFLPSVDDLKDPRNLLTINY